VGNRKGVEPNGQSGRTCGCAAQSAVLDAHFQLWYMSKAGSADSFLRFSRVVVPTVFESRESKRHNGFSAHHRAIRLTIDGVIALRRLVNFATRHKRLNAGLRLSSRAICAASASLTSPAHAAINSFREWRSWSWGSMCLSQPMLLIVRTLWPQEDSLRGRLYRRRLGGDNSHKATASRSSVRARGGPDPEFHRARDASRRDCFGLCALSVPSLSHKYAST